MTAYYNEFDPYAAEWLRNLIRDGLIAPGDVDTRSIEDVRPDDLTGYTQCHFFAGIGGWSAALRSAGWPDDRRIWTGSCPCQPFSSAGKGAGFDDERHLWPAFHYLIQQCRPSIYVGEQVASKDGYAWLDLVFADVENLGDTLWPVVLPVAGVGAPGERHRIFWLGYAGGRPADPHLCGRSQGDIAAEGVGPGRSADTGCGDDRLAHAVRGGAGHPPGRGMGAQTAADGGDGRLSGQCGGAGLDGALERVGDTSGERAGRDGRTGACSQAPGEGIGQHDRYLGDASVAPGGIERVVDSDHPRPQGRGGDPLGWNGGGRAGQCAAGESGLGCGLADATDGGHDGSGDQWGRRSESPDRRPPTGPSALNGFWRDADWLFCTDGKWRPAEPLHEPLSYGLPRSVGALGTGVARYAMVAGCDADSLRAAKRYRVGSLRGYGNAINVPVAAEWIRTWMGDI